MIPETCDAGLKEWAGVCDALATGRQSIILRKGGIDESAGPGTFEPKHSVFWLYPTRLHESQQGLREIVPTGSSGKLSSIEPGKIPIRVLGVAQIIGRVDDERILERFREFHVWADETVLSRLRYRTKGVWVLAIRAYLREPPFLLEVTPEQEGCKSWVTLEQPLSTDGVQPVIDDEAWQVVQRRLHSILRET
jgi:hypothetical protein